MSRLLKPTSSSGLRFTSILLGAITLLGCGVQAGNPKTPDGKLAEVRIDGRYPAAVSSADTLVLKGRNFGAARGAVRFGQQVADVIEWSPTEVRVHVPPADDGVCSALQITDADGNPSNRVPVGQGDRNLWIPLNEIPSPRAGHATVWTGSEMFVWGGGTNTGWRYNPKYDTWLPTATPINIKPSPMNGTPLPNGDPVAIASDDKVFLFGQTAARYDLVTDQWSILSEEDAPKTLVGQSATLADQEIILMGGNNCWENKCVPNIGIYSIKTQSWRRINSGTTARYGHSAIWTGSELLVWGGFQQINGSEIALATGFAYNPATDKWRALPKRDPASGRAYHNAVWTGTEMVIWGGTTAKWYETITDGAAYNPKTNSWRAIADAPRPWLIGEAVWTGEHMLISTGGFYPNAWNDLSLAYDPVKDQWHELGGPGSRTQQSSIWTGEELIAWGGVDQTGFPTNSGSRYNPRTKTWRAMIGDPNAPRRYEFSTKVWTGKEFLVWGAIGQEKKPAQGARYDPVTNQWRPMAPAGEQHPWRWDHEAVWTGSQMLVVGGRDNSFVVQPSLLYNPALDTWQEVLDAQEASNRRAGHALVWTGDQAIVLGGEASPYGLSFTPATLQWSALPITGAPSDSRMVGAVWTGEDVIFADQETPPLHGWKTLRTGRYSPRLNQWFSTAQTDVKFSSTPQPRLIWLGESLFVVGDSDNDSGRESAGAEYNLAQNQWRTINLAGAPASDELAVAWNGTKVLVFAGNELETGRAAGGYVWSPAESKASMINTGCSVEANDSNPKPGHAAVWNGDRFLIIGPQGVTAYLP